MFQNRHVNLLKILAVINIKIYGEIINVIVRKYILFIVNFLSIKSGGYKYNLYSILLFYLYKIYKY